jgi:hypothetical protein
VTWNVKVTEEYAAWFSILIKEDLASAIQVAQAIAALREEGPALGRPLVDRIQGSAIHHPFSAAAARWRQSRELAAVVPAEHPDSRAVVSGVHRGAEGVAHA